VLQLIEAARSGEEVVIVKGRKPVATLTPIADLVSDWFLKDRNRPNFFELMDEEDIAAWEGSRTQAPIVSSATKS
jgi:antitoxin (DNA-binding transcriptional repressor) of toxin-antitoxin stability system